MNEKQRLKEFIEDNIPFYELKKVGFWLKGTRKIDYEKISARICWYFGFKSIYEYETFGPGNMTETPGANVVVGKFKDTVDEKGYKPGGGFHLDIYQNEFECPCCTCKNEAKDNNKMAYTMKCKGCKRKLFVVHQFNGNIQVTELKNTFNKPK